MNGVWSCCCCESICLFVLEETCKWWPYCDIISVTRPGVREHNTAVQHKKKQKPVCHNNNNHKITTQNILIATYKRSHLEYHKYNLYWFELCPWTLSLTITHNLTIKMQISSLVVGGMVSFFYVSYRMSAFFYYKYLLTKRKKKTA